MRDMGEFPPLAPQDITCKGGIKIDFSAMFGGDRAKEDADGE